MKQHFSNENGEWTEENFTVGETYGNGRVRVIERGERQSNGDTSVLFLCTNTGKTQLASMGHLTVFWGAGNARYVSTYLRLAGGIVKSNDPAFFKATR